MKKYYFLIFPLILSTVLISCNQNKSNLETIKALEAELFSEEAIFNEDGKNKAFQLVEAYLNYADENPEDSITPEYLFKAGDIDMNLGNAPSAISTFNRIIYDYPEYKKAPECLFLVAYIYENYLSDYGKATELYTLFVEKYPDNDFADDAEMSIQNMGKSPEELIKEFEREE